MPFLRLLSASFLTILLSAPLVLSQQPPPPQSLGDVLLMVLDNDKDQKVTMTELQSQLKMLETLFQEDQEGEYLPLLRTVQKWSPQLFALLDANGDQKLSAKELKVLTLLEASMKKDGSFKPFLRSCFQLLDTNDNDEISAEEWAQANEKASGLAIEVHTLFPTLRSTPQELEEFVQNTLLGMDANTQAASTKAFEILDENGDGAVQRKEVGAAYNKAGRKFMEISKTIKQMGPMLAMFGGGGGMDNMMNMNNMRTEF